MKKILILLLIFVSISLIAGTTGKISGRVTDKQTNAPLPFVNVVVVGTGLGAVTDEDGYYVILNVPPGTYNLEARMIGYHSQTVQNVDVFVDQTMVINFQLTPAVIKLKGKVVRVYARKVIEKDVTSTKSVMTGRAIQRMPVTNPVQAMQTNTNFTVDPRRGEIHVRGGRGDEVMYMVDGMEVRDPLVGGGLALQIGNAALQQMEILTGGFSAEYGDAQSAVVNIVTKEGNEKKQEMNVYYLNDHIFNATSFNTDQVSFSIDGPNIFTANLLPLLGVRIPWKSTYIITTTGDWTDTYTPMHVPFNRYKLGPLQYGLRDNNHYDITAKLATKISPTMKIVTGFNKSYNFYVPFSDRYRSFAFRDIPWDAYQVTRNTSQYYLKWAHTLSAKTFYFFNVGLVNTEGLLTPGGHSLDEINNYTGDEHGTSNNPLDVTIGWPGIDGLDEPYIDEPRCNGVYDYGEDFVDENNNGVYDLGEPFIDTPLPNGHYDVGEPFNDYNHNGIWDGREPFKDYGVDGIPDTYDEGEGDGIYEVGEPFSDYNQNGVRDNPLADGHYDYGYDQWAHWHRHLSRQITLKFDWTSQITKEHMLKAGFDLRFNHFDMADIEYGWWRDTLRDTANVPGLWKTRGIFRDWYTRDPYDGALYIQDKIETKGMIVNAGFRVDFLNPNTPGREDTIPILGGLTRSGTEVRLSPRIGVSYPVTDKDKFYFNYGKFMQAPEFQYFYEDTTQFGGAIRLYGNPNLVYKTTMAYEFGVQHAFTDATSITVSTFFKDIRGLIDTEKRGVPPITYQIRVNKDYGDVRGIEMKFSKIYSHYTSFMFDYTLSWAMGKSSSDRQGYDYSYQGIPLPLREYPLNWDERHKIMFNYNLDIPAGEGPVFLGRKMLDNWGINLLLQYGSGLPWTPTDSLATPNQTPNCRRMPYTMTVDVKMYKGFKVGGSNLSFDLTIKNIFNKKNWLQVYTDTGYPDSRGYTGNIDRNNPSYFGPPRQILLGISISF